MAEVDDERELASAGGHSDDEKAVARAAKDQTDAAERDAGFDRTLGDIRGLPETGRPVVGGGGKNLTDRLKGMLKKRLAIAAVAGVLAVGLGIAGFLALLPYKLVHFEENIVHFFDKRTQHAISTRQGQHYRAIFDEHSGHPQGFNQRTGHPIRDAIANFRMDKFEADLKSSGLGAVHDQKGKLVGFYDLPAVEDGQTARVTNDAIEVRDSKGNLVSRDRLDSTKFHDLSDTSVKDRRSFLRTQIANRFPDDGFFRRSVRARALDARFGVRRRLLATKREQIADKEIELKQKLADAIRSRVLGSDGSPGSNSSAEEDAKSKIKKAGEDGGSGIKGASSIGFAYDVCGVYGISKAIDTGLFIIRESQLMRISISVLATADQIKRGDLHSSQLKVLMQQLNGFEKSGGFQRISGSTGAKVSGQKFSLDGGGNIKKASKNIEDKVDSFNTNIGPLHVKPGPWACGVLNSTPGQLAGPALAVAQGIVAVTGVGDLADVAAEAIGQTIKQGVKFIAYSEGTKAFVNLALKAGSGPILDAAATGADWGDATVAGYDSYSNNNARAMGGVQLTAPQVARLDSEATIDDQYAVAGRSLAYKLFSPDYQNSLTTRLAMATPTSFGDVSSSFNNMLAAIFPGSLKTDWDTVKGLVDSISPRAMADGGDADPVGASVPQYGMTDDLLNKYPDPQANEDWVINHLQAKGQTLMDAGSDSSGELTDQYISHNDDYHKFVNECLLSDDQSVVKDQGGSCASDFTQEERERYTVYRFDLGIANENSSYNNDNNDQDPSEVSNSSTSGPTSLDPNSLYNDSSSISCANGTKDLGIYDGYHGGQKVQIRLCAVSNLQSSGEEANGGYGVSGANGKCPVNSRVSGAVFNMVKAAQKDGISLTSLSCFRTMSHQQALWNQNPDPSRVAQPGYSNHQMGLAIDFGGLPSTASPGSGPVWDWLSKNAANFGYKNYPAEAWHWSPTGN